MHGQKSFRGRQRRQHSIAPYLSKTAGSQCRAYVLLRETLRRYRRPTSASHPAGCKNHIKVCRLTLNNLLAAHSHRALTAFDPRIRMHRITFRISDLISSATRPAHPSRTKFEVAETSGSLHCSRKSERALSRRAAGTVSPQAYSRIHRKTSQKVSFLPQIYGLSTPNTDSSSR